MNKTEVLNIEILKAYAATPEDVRFFADIFIRQTAGDLVRLKESCDANNHGDWNHVCHKVRGAASMAGASHLRDLCEEGEEMADTGSAPKQVLFEKMQAAFDAVCRAFDDEAVPREQAAP